MAEGVYIVADFGKTNSKLTLWSREGECIARETRANDVPAANPYVPLDVVGIGDWLVGALAKFADHPVEAIIPVAHGAAVAGIRDGELAFLPMDYEWEIPAEIAAAYRAQRPDFGLTGSPALPAGLNMGAQLHYLETLGLLKGVTLMPYAQYWAWLLSGEAASEVTSLGCHSDLWLAGDDKFLWSGRNACWTAQFAQWENAGDRIGNLRPDLAASTGLPPDVAVHVGLHDSNAALVAARGFDEIGSNEATVLSTGTWFVAMRSTKEWLDPQYPPEDRDCLINVDVEHNPTPSARWMGGREMELLGARIDVAGVAGVADAVASGAMLLPSQVPDCGPFPKSRPRWINPPADPIIRNAAIALYAALMADASLSLIGATNILLVEGRFANSNIFASALATLRPDMAVYTSSAEADVSFGALRMIAPMLKPPGTLNRIAPLGIDLATYRQKWRDQTK